MHLTALTLDLDDTLWPVMPVIERAEQLTHAWLAVHAPATAGRFGLVAMRALRADVGRRHPQWAHDLSQLRRLALLEALAASGDDVALAEPAFEVFFNARQAVALYADVAPALDRLAARYRLLALSNGNADLAATGLTRWFVGSVSAQRAGVAKPDARIFAHACAELGCSADEIMHVGDDLALDIHGARQAGMHTAWIRRAGHPEPPLASVDLYATGHHWELPDLLALADRLGV
ncbi:MAG: HAD family hydrolase [Leptothrix sp. (in: b-proteobacteria)]